MNYLYNGEHQDLSNLRPRNRFKDLFSYYIPTLDRDILFNCY